MILNQALINGNNIFTSYGVGIKDGMKKMEALAETKSEDYDWPEMDGKEYSLSDKLQDLNITLNCWMRANSMLDYKTKKTAFDDVLKSPYLKDFLVVSTGQSYKVKYNRISNFEWITKDVDKPFTKFDLELTIVKDLNQQIVTRILDGNG